MEHDRLKSAYEIWVHYQPKEDVGTCCSKRHHYPNGVFKLDEFVCDRERAWRNYVRVRDINPSFMGRYTK